MARRRLGQVNTHTHTHTHILARRKHTHTHILARACVARRRLGQGDINPKVACFTSTKVQILTLMRLPGASYCQHGNTCEDAFAIHVRLQLQQVASRSGGAARLDARFQQTAASIATISGFSNRREPPSSSHSPSSVREAAV